MTIFFLKINTFKNKIYVYEVITIIHTSMHINIFEVSVCDLIIIVISSAYT